jgi:hypothetical protein
MIGCYFDLRAIGGMPIKVTFFLRSQGVLITSNSRFFGMFVRVPNGQFKSIKRRIPKPCAGGSSPSGHTIRELSSRKQNVYHLFAPANTPRIAWSSNNSKPLW